MAFVENDSSPADSPPAQGEKPAASDMAGVVLCGGESRRMGADKATLLYEGEPLVVRAARRLATVADPVLVACGSAGRLGALPWRQIDDGSHAGCGPLAGIVAALEASPHPVVAVLAVDLPHARADVLAALRAEWTGQPALVPLDSDGRPQPLHALYSTAAAPALSQFLAAGGRRVLAGLDMLGATWVRVERLPPGPEDWSRNLNRAADLPHQRFDP